MIRGEECWITLTRIEGAQPRVLAHEFLHHWLWEEIGVEASCKLDNFEYEESPTGWVDDGGLILAPFEALRDRMGELMERLDLDEDVLDMSDRDVGDREPLLES